MAFWQYKNQATAKASETPVLCLIALGAIAGGDVASAVAELAAAAGLNKGDLLWAVTPDGSCG